MSAPQPACAAEHREEEGQRFCCGQEPCQAPDIEDIARLAGHLGFVLMPWQERLLGRALATRSHNRSEAA